MELTTRYAKCQNVAHRLNAEAYALQATEGRVRRFTPCAKADLFIRASVSKTPLAQVIADAAMTPCRCHPAIGSREIFDMQFESSYRLARATS